MSTTKDNVNDNVNVIIVKYDPSTSGTKPRLKRGKSEHCSAINCRNSRQFTPDLSFFKFPVDPERCKRWVLNSRRLDLIEGPNKRTPDQLHRSYVFCSVHFEDSQFTNWTRSRLNRGTATPTIFDVPNPPPRMTPKRQPPRKRALSPTPPSPAPDYEEFTSSVHSTVMTEQDSLSEVKLEPPDEIDSQLHVHFDKDDVPSSRSQHHSFQQDTVMTEQDSVSEVKLEPPDVIESEPYVYIDRDEAPSPGSQHHSFQQDSVMTEQDSQSEVKLEPPDEEIDSQLHVHFDRDDVPSSWSQHHNSQQESSHEAAEGPQTEPVGQVEPLDYRIERNEDFSDEESTAEAVKTFHGDAETETAEGNEQMEFKIERNEEFSYSDMESESNMTKKLFDVKTEVSESVENHEDMAKKICDIKTEFAECIESDDDMTRKLSDIKTEQSESVENHEDMTKKLSDVIKTESNEPSEDITDTKKQTTIAKSRLYSLLVGPEFVETSQESSEGEDKSKSIEDPACVMNPLLSGGKNEESSSLSSQTFSQGCGIRHGNLPLKSPVLKLKKIDPDKWSGGKNQVSSSSSSHTSSQVSGMKQDDFPLLRIPVRSEPLKPNQYVRIPQQIQSGVSNHSDPRGPTAIQTGVQPAVPCALAYRLNSLYICDICDKVFSYNCLLLKHKKTHTGEKPYKCDVCDKTFTSNSYLLNVHKKTHTGEKPFKCDICGKEYLASSSFSKHKRTHEKEKA